MRVLVSGSTKMVGGLAPAWPDSLGHLLTPGNGITVASLLKTGLPFACDNGAYSGLDEAAFRKMLGKVAGAPRCLFVVVPDVVADARATLALFGRWAPECRAAGQPLAFVGQDGAEDCDLPWADFDAFFVGGSTRWKLSGAAADLGAEAKARGKWLHMGRVNSMRRLRIAYRLGCDSVDGSSYSRWRHRTITHRPDMSLERHLRFLAALARQAREQRGLFPEEAPA
jgi:hypothetical protein